MDSEYSTITISIPKVKISQLEKNTYIYQMDIATRWSKWHLEKKYGDFVELHKYLSKEFNNLPEFPESIIGAFLGESEQDVEEYRDILEDYMRITSLRKDIINSTFYSQFLQLQKNSQAMLVNKPKFQGEFEIEQKINDDGKVVIDFYYCDTFIVFATGNNSPLEKFNATIANTKFPWQDDDEAEFVLPLGTIECWKLKKKPYGYTRIWARNYPTEVTKFLFLPDAESMIVGLSDGSIEIFKLVPRGPNTYYQHQKTLNSHEDSITGLHLDKINMVLYSASIDGFLNITDAKNGVLIDSLEMNTEITGICGESETGRLVIALGEGNIQVYEYDYKAKLKILTCLATPDSWNVKVMSMDRVKNYFFVGAFDSGSVYIYELPKPGNQKFMKQVALLKNKEGIVSMHFVPERMELIVACQSGQIFFWDCIKGKQICTHLPSYPQTCSAHSNRAKSAKPTTCPQIVRSQPLNEAAWQNSSNSPNNGVTPVQPSKKSEKSRSGGKLKIYIRQGKPQKGRKEIRMMMILRAGIGKKRVMRRRKVGLILLSDFFGDWGLDFFFFEDQIIFILFIVQRFLRRSASPSIKNQMQKSQNPQKRNQKIPKRPKQQAQMQQESQSLHMCPCCDFMLCGDVIEQHLDAQRRKRLQSKRKSNTRIVDTFIGLKNYQKPVHRHKRNPKQDDSQGQNQEEQHLEKEQPEIKEEPTPPKASTVSKRPIIRKKGGRGGRGKRRGGRGKGRRGTVLCRRGRGRGSRELAGLMPRRQKSNEIQQQQSISKEQQQQLAKTNRIKNPPQYQQSLPSENSFQSESHHQESPQIFQQSDFSSSQEDRPLNSYKRPQLMHIAKKYRHQIFELMQQLKMSQMKLRYLSELQDYNQKIRSKLGLYERVIRKHGLQDQITQEKQKEKEKEKQRARVGGGEGGQQRMGDDQGGGDMDEKENIMGD